MDKLSQKIILIIFTFYLAAFICFFVFSIFGFAGVSIEGKTLTDNDPHSLNMEISVLREKPESEIQLLSNFKISWIISNSLRLFIQYLLPVQSTALLVIFSLFFPWKLGPQGMQIPFANVIGKSIFLFLVLTLIYAGLTEGILPGVLKKQSDQLYKTEIAIDYFEKAKEELDSKKKDKDYSYAAAVLKAYLHIDPGNAVVEKTLDWVESTLEIKTEGPDTSSSVNSGKIVQGQKAADLILKASASYSQEDYYSALYYANLAFKLDDSRQEAQRIAAESRDAIRSLAPDKSEREAKEYFELKRTGFDTLSAGNPIDAYYIFKKLSAESNNDKDIPEFLARSLEDIADKSFFIDEAEKYLSAPGINNIVFLNNEKTLIYIEKMILIDESNAFFFNIEVIGFDKLNKIIKHFTAPYGKYCSESESIIMNAIDRNYSSVSYKPVYKTGSDSEGENIILKLSPSLLNLQYLGQKENKLKFMNIIELFNYGPVFYKYGYIKEPAQILILDRLAKPFTFLIVSFLSVSLGWFLRIRKYTFSLTSVILIPLIGYLIHNILLIYEYGIHLVIGFSLIRTGFFPALIILTAFQAVILFFSLVSIAGQKD